MTSARARGIELLCFAATGVVGLGVDVLVLYAALALGLGWYGGRALSFLAAVWTTWRLNRRFTFAGAPARPSWGEWWRYLLAMSAGGLVNYVVYAGVVTMLPQRPLLPLLAVAAGSLSGMVVNYLSAKRYVFRRRGAP